MAASPSVEDKFTFVEGLNTEGEFFLTPKNAWKEGDNVIPDTRGSVYRRKALDFEAGYGITYDSFNPGFLIEVPGDPGAYIPAVGDAYQGLDGNTGIEAWYYDNIPDPLTKHDYSGTVFYFPGQPPYLPPGYWYSPFSGSSQEIGALLAVSHSWPLNIGKYYHMRCELYNHGAAAPGTEMDILFYSTGMLGGTQMFMRVDIAGSLVSLSQQGGLVIDLLASSNALAVIPGLSTLEVILDCDTGDVTFWQNGSQIATTFQGPMPDFGGGPSVQNLQTAIINRQGIQDTDGIPPYLNTARGGNFAVWLDGISIPTDFAGTPTVFVPQVEEYHYGQVAQDAYSLNVWDTVNGNGEKSFTVIQIGHLVFFADDSKDPLTSGIKTFFIDLGNYQAYGNNEVIGGSVITCASCYGRLVITSKDTNPILVSYDTATDTISVRELSLKIRDFNGFRSPVPPQEEKTQAEWIAINFWPNALYNLYNQGWTDTKLAAYTAAHGGDYPANTKIWTYGKDTSDVFQVSILDKQDFGFTPAPRGKFILDVFYMDRADAINQAIDTTAQTASIPADPCNDLTYTWS